MAALTSRDSNPVLSLFNVSNKDFFYIFRFSQKEKSRLFARLFRQKVDGTQGGLEWIVWSLDEMVRDLVTYNPTIFCKFAPFYLELQLKISQIAAHLAAEQGRLYTVGKVA